MGLFDCEVLKNSIRAFSNKIRLNISYEKNERFALLSVNTSRPFFSGVIKRPFYHLLNLWHRTTYYESFIQFAWLDFC